MDEFYRVTIENIGTGAKAAGDFVSFNETFDLLIKVLRAELDMQKKILEGKNAHGAK